MRHFNKWFAVFALVTMLGMSFGSSRAQADAIKVLLLPYLSFAPILIAEAEGFFAEQNLDVEYIRLDSSSASIPALVSGEIDVLGGAINANLLNAIVREANIRIVADKGTHAADRCPAGSLVARQELLDSGTMDNPEALRGLIFDARLTGHSGYFVDMALQRFGVRIDEVEINRAELDVLSEALTNGSLDVAETSEPVTTELLASGDFGVWARSNEILPDMSYAYIVYGERLIEREPELGVRFMTAYLQGSRQYDEGKTERNLDILAEATELDRALIEESCLSYMNPTGEINVESVLAFQDWALEYDLIDAPLEPEQFWDSRFIDAANAALDEDE